MLVTELLKCFGLIVFLTFIISIINSRTEGIIVYKLGYVGRILFSFIGTPVHELSHAFMCILFRHKITDMRLLILDPNSQCAGYVMHQYNKNSIYQNIGNFFIGTAPVFCGFMILSFIYKTFMATPKSISFWIALLVCQQIIIHMRCSKEDVMNSFAGALTFVLVIVAIGVLNPTLIAGINQLLLRVGFLSILVSGINYLIFLFLFANRV